jgi:hypothetical protein
MVKNRDVELYTTIHGNANMPAGTPGSRTTQEQLSKNVRTRKNINIDGKLIAIPK